MGPGWASGRQPSVISRGRSAVLARDSILGSGLSPVMGLLSFIDRAWMYCCDRPLRHTTTPVHQHAPSSLRPCPILPPSTPVLHPDDSISHVITHKLPPRVSALGAGERVGPHEAPEPNSPAPPSALESARCPPGQLPPPTLQSSHPPACCPCSLLVPRPKPLQVLKPLPSTHRLLAASPRHNLPDALHCFPAVHAHRATCASSPRRCAAAAHRRLPSASAQAASQAPPCAAC